VNKILKQSLKSILSGLGYEVRRSPQRVVRDISEVGLANAYEAKKHVLDGCSSLIIFVVGAFTGTIATSYREHFHQDDVYCFEPFPNSYRQLVLNTQGDSHIHQFNFGMSDSTEERTFFSNTYAPTNSLLASDRRADITWGQGVVQTAEVMNARSSTIDTFVAENSIESIDILNLDVQGDEHLVLAGASETFKRNAVRIICAEVITRPAYDGQKTLHEMRALYDELGFQLHSIYDVSYMPSGAISQMYCVFCGTDS
jgi:FkbM family methyltransferase